MGWGTKYRPSLRHDTDDERSLLIKILHALERIAEQNERAWMESKPPAIQEKPDQEPMR